MLKPRTITSHVVVIIACAEISDTEESGRQVDVLGIVSDVAAGVTSPIRSQPSIRNP
ncbi:hypothetical protein DPMN_082168 [Dreissena polymorpha]|uniref:Uncharacterized protein n=1 Tax=Dreissena polymorpha TaxID=45954 RepID=A0A9D3YA88_DREPO|nr:hypothetical protein DPMN_082168 [Dreissena polymorpha]